MSELIEQEEAKYFSIREYKPIITYAGDRELFCSIQGLLAQSLPQESSEWRRLYGRTVKSVNLSAIFVPFSKDILHLNTHSRLLKRPILHVFWTQCSDLETYKNVVNEEIKEWLHTLGQYDISDWVIVLVETYDFRKHTKLLPRTTVLDKIKSDFGVKHADRCLSVINPLKSDFGSSSTWRALLVNFRLLMLTAYDGALLSLEEYIRSHRECRNQEGWSFCKYFLLQEELAFVLEMLGIYEDALIQYDELDALFTQFLRNSSHSDVPAWLSVFQVPITKWNGLYLTDKINQNTREAIQEQSVSLLEFRCYLFSRQAAMLLLSFKPWEIAQRALPFIRSTLCELKILELECPHGALSCWIFLCCLEIIQTCQRFKETAHVDSCSHYTCSLLEECTEKLLEIGQLCGLMPGCESSSYQLHTIVNLLAGIGDSPNTYISSSGHMAPADKLKEALSSKDAFRKHYLELSEQAMVTYKHKGRIRSARLIGKKLADFHIWSLELSKAVGLLSNLLVSYEDDNWPLLINQTRLQLLHCYKQLADTEKFLKICVQVTSTEDMDSSLRVLYYHEMMRIIQELDSEGILSFEDTFTVSNVNVTVQKFGPRVEVDLEIESKLPLDILCSNVCVAVYECKSNEAKIAEKIADYETYGGHSGFFSGSVKHTRTALRKLPIGQKIDRQEDRSVASVSVTCKHMKSLLRRCDSHKVKKVGTLSKVDSNKCLSSGSIILKSGKNRVTLTSKQEEVSGTYCLGELMVSVFGKLHFVSSNNFSKFRYEVEQVHPSVRINSQLSDMFIAGVENCLILSVDMGTQLLAESIILKLRSSPGLKMQDQQCAEKNFEEAVDITLPSGQSVNNTNLSIPLKIFSEFPPQTNNSLIERKMWISCPWSDGELCLSVMFYPPFLTVNRLYTSHSKKYLLITVVGLTTIEVEISAPSLHSVPLVDSDVVFQSLVPTSSQPFVVSVERKVQFMWEMRPKDESVLSSECNIVFSCDFCVRNQMSHYEYPFKITSYATLYTLETRIEPMRDLEFCRTNTTCHLHLTVRRIGEIKGSSLMYEVVTDQATWAVCGNSTGVITLDTDKRCVSLDIMPLTNGYLPLPLVKLSKYVPNEGKFTGKGTSTARRESFCPGEVYSISKAAQVHVLPSLGVE